MLKPSEALDEIHQQYTMLRGRFTVEIAKIIAELEKPSRNRAVIFSTASAMIDAAARDYQAFLTGVNAARLQEEAKAETHEELLNKRREWGVTTSQTNLFRSEINRWHEVKSLVYSQAKPRRHKLYVDETRLPPSATAQLMASDDVFSWLHKALNNTSQSDAAKEQGCFPDIGLPNSDFHAHMHAAYRLCLAQKRQAPVRFLDVGCGGGLKVYSALRYFDKGYGFDLDTAYVEAGQRFFEMDKAAEGNIFAHDALTFEGYGDFDIIYFYRPISDEALLCQLERRIAENARPETILIAPYITFPERHQELGCGHVAGAVYLAKTSQKKADAWRRKAERMGVFVRKTEPPGAQSIWTPLIEASRGNGHDFPHRHKKSRY